MPTRAAQKTVTRIPAKAAKAVPRRFEPTKASKGTQVKVLEKKSVKSPANGPGVRPAKSPTPPLPIDPNVDASLEAALRVNGWDPKNPRKLKSGHYMDPAELYYYAIKCQMAGSAAAAGRDGERFAELCMSLARHYSGRLMFKDSGQMANVMDDVICSAGAKCCLVVNRFRPWEIPGVKINNAFSYMTTIAKHSALEAIGNNILTGRNQIYLEDLRAEGQSLGDII